MENSSGLFWKSGYLQFVKHYIQGEGAAFELAAGYAGKQLQDGVSSAK